MDVWSLEQFACEVDRPERHGRYCFFPISALVTAGAGLLLALGLQLVEDEGGHVAYCDTDSLVIVACEEGGFVLCEGGDYRDSEGRRYIKALSYEQVDRILKRLEPLNPYDQTVIPGSVFKKECVVLDDAGRPRQLWFYGARDKCYALYTRDERGDPEIVKASSHGVGVYNAPSKALREIQKSGLPRWVENAWLSLLRDVHGLPAERPVGDYPAIRQLTMSTYNIWKHYSKTSKPFDFLVVATTIPRYKELYGCGCDDPRPATFPYDDARDWKKQNWFCIKCGQPVKIFHNGLLLVKTYDDVLREALYNGLQRKRLTAAGESPTYAKPAVGLTIPRPNVIEGVRYCGKEILVDLSEAPEEEGLTPEEINATVSTEYRKPAAHEARRLLAEREGRIAEIAGRARVDRTTVWRIRSGQKPRGSTAGKLLVALQKGEYDCNHLRGLVREAGVERFVRLSGLNRRTIYRFLSGRKPNKRTTVRIIFALQLVYAEREGLAA